MQQIRWNRQRAALAVVPALLVALAGAALAEQPADFDAALALARQADIPVVVDFATDW